MKTIMKIKDVVLSTWFPADDQFATKMARICILREELMFELHCSMNAHKLSDAGNYDESWIKLYFFRKMFITISEIRSAIEALSQDRDFKLFLKKQSIPFRHRFEEIKRNLHSTSDTIKEFRNTLSGHIKQDCIWDALQTMDYDRHGIIQISRESPRKTHYKFTGELIMAVMLRNIPNNRQIDKANEIVNTFFKSTDKLFPLIDFLIIGYGKYRQLL